MSEWQIVGINRETGESETVYEGNDYSMVSDTMVNPGESSADYSHMSLYENGRLIERHEQPHSGQGRGDLRWIVFIVLILIVLYFIIH